MAGFAPDGAVARQAFLQAYPGVLLAVAVLHVAARPFVDLVRIMRVPWRLLAHVGEVRPRFLEVVVVVVVPAGLDLLAQRPGVDVLAVRHGRLLGRVERDHGRARQGLVAGHDVVGDHQGVLAARVLEVVVRPFMLQEARDEVEVALAVLHAVVPGAVGARELELHRITVAAQNLFHDLRDGLELEDAEVLAPRGHPEPGLQAQVVRVQAMVLALHAEARDQAVQVAPAAAFRLDLHRRRLAQQRLGIDVAPLREQVDVE